MKIWLKLDSILRPLDFILALLKGTQEGSEWLGIRVLSLLITYISVWWDYNFLFFGTQYIDDGVYMADEVKRQEYVMNETGLYFYGSKYRIGSSPWNFGQVSMFFTEDRHVM